MEFDINQFIKGLKTKLDEFDISGAASDSDQFIKTLVHSNDAIPLDKAEKILKLLRNKRMFGEMQKVADTLLLTGRISYNIQKQYAQALIDEGNFSAAIYTLQALITNIAGSLPSDKTGRAEYAEAKGLIGRVYKQSYVNAGQPGNPQCVHLLSLAVSSYYSIYKDDYTKTWHGINTVALLERAKRDKVLLPLKLNAEQMARDILHFIKEKENADAWDYVTAAEACVALNKPEKALKWLSGYARMPKCDAFELASTLRQFEEVWQLDIKTPMGQYLLPLLRAELLKRKGGSFSIELAAFKEQQANESKITEQYEAIVDKQPEESAGEAVKLERVFGTDSFRTYKWYMLGAARCLTVARIGRDSTRGEGTGFLLRGKDLKESWGEDFVLLTNAHVVSTDPADRALKPEQVGVIFEAMNSKQEFRNLKLIWSSAVKNLDASVLLFSEADQERLKKLFSDIELYPIAANLPDILTPPNEKVYVIGHPLGGTLQISFQDNILIDHDKTTKIHYRTPTQPGSSGSPVFNQDWELIGLHHAGSNNMQCLNGKTGTYPANEGIWIQSIIKELKNVA